MGQRANHVRRKKSHAKRQSRKTRQLQFEQLENRWVFTGVVEVFTDAPAVAPGELLLVGDGNGNHVEVSPVAGEVNAFSIKSGDGQTLFIHNGGAPVPSIPLIRGISGAIDIQLGAGNDEFEFLGASNTDLLRVQGDLTITNAEGINTNTLNALDLLGDLTVDRPLGGIVSNSSLEIIDSLVEGNVLVANDTDGGGGPSTTIIRSSDQPTMTTLINGNVVVRNDQGETSFTITDSRINGFLDIDNDTGGGAVQDTIDIQGTSVGVGIFDTPPGGPPAMVDVVTINNGDGGSRTTFTRGRTAAAPTGAGRVTVYGGINIDNGDNIAGIYDIVTFTDTDVLGIVDVNNDDGDTTITFSNSKIGMDLASAPGLPAPAVLPPGFGVGYGGPLLVESGAGRDDVDIINLEAQYGASIDNGDGGQNGGGDVNILGSTFGHHPFGPNLGAGLPGVGLNIAGDDADDTVMITDTKVTGDLELGALAAGRNMVSLDNFELRTGQLIFDGGVGRNELTVTSSGGVGQSVIAGIQFLGGDSTDRVSITDTILLAYVNIDLGAGADRLELRGGTDLPDSVLVALPFALEGGAGADELGIDVGILLPFPATGFDIPL